MKRLLIPALAASLLMGCDGDDPKSGLSSRVESATAGSGAPTAAKAATSTASANNAASGDTNATPAAASSLAVLPPTAPPPLPEPVRDVVRLGQTSVSEGVLVDFIGTIKEPFSLSADQIIYLTDLGIPGPAIQALLKRSALFADAPAPETQLAAAPQPVSAPAPAAASTNAARVAIATNAAPPVVGPVQTIAQAPAPAQGTTVIQAPTTEVTVNTFYDSLSAYGSWVEVPEYGWCWQPSVAAVNINWQPYADNGAWLWTDSGWYWNSYYSWGWAPFHYGRWHRARFGWCWVPDTYWAPAWVTWRSSDSYCGWAPLPPSARWSVGVGLVWHGRRAAIDCDFGLIPDSFVYVGWNRFCDPHPWHHYVPRRDTPHIYAGTRIVNDFRFHGGGSGRPDHAGRDGHGGGGPGIINHGPGIRPVQPHMPGGVPTVQLASSRTVPTPAAATGLVARPGQNPHVLPVYRPTIAAAATPAPGSGSGSGAGTGTGTRPPQFMPPTRTQAVAAGSGRTLLGNGPAPQAPSNPMASGGPTGPRIVAAQTASSAGTAMTPKPTPFANYETRPAPTVIPRSSAGRDGATSPDRGLPVPPRGANSQLPSYNPNAPGDNHVLGSASGANANPVGTPTTEARLNTRRAETAPLDPNLQRTLAGTSSGAPAQANPVTGGPTIVTPRPQTPRRVYPSPSLSVGDGASVASPSPAPAPVQRYGSPQGPSAPVASGGSYGGSRSGNSYGAPQAPAPVTPSYPGGGGGGRNPYSAPAPSQGSYSQPAQSARSYSAPVQAPAQAPAPSYNPSPRVSQPSYSPPVNNTPPTRSYSAPAPSQSSGGGANGHVNNNNKRN